MSSKEVQLVWARKRKLVDNFSASVVRLCLPAVSHNVNIVYRQIITMVAWHGAWTNNINCLLELWSRYCMSCGSGMSRSSSVSVVMYWRRRCVVAGLTTRLDSTTRQQIRYCRHDQWFVSHDGHRIGFRTVDERKLHRTHFNSFTKHTFITWRVVSGRGAEGHSTDFDDCFGTVTEAVYFFLNGSSWFWCIPVLLFSSLSNVVKV